MNTRTRPILALALLAALPALRVLAQQPATPAPAETPAAAPATSAASTADPAAPVAWRLDMAEAVRRTGPLSWTDTFAGVQRATPEIFGDVVLVRKDAPASYHLAATLDDAYDEVTCVTRGADLFAASHLHRLLQALFGLPVPVWHHHPLLLDERGAKLAKRRSSPGLAERRVAGEDGHALAKALRAERFPAGITLSQGLYSGL